MESTRPVQLTLATVKLSLEPTPSGPILEFTDYGTDITWVSGRIFAMLSGTDESPCSHIALQNSSWEILNDNLNLEGAVGDIKVRLFYHLSDDPLRLEERISISNPGNKPIVFDRFRIGPTWSPPATWWQYWGYWRLMKIDEDFDPESDPGRLPGEKLSTVRDMLRRVEKSRGRIPVPVEFESEAKGWIFTDERRYLLVLKESSEIDEVCNLDVLENKPAPSFIMGGISNVVKGLDWARQLNPGMRWESGTTIYAPGTGGWSEAIGTYKQLARLA